MSEPFQPKNTENTQIIQHLSEYFHFVENHTQLFKVIHLGYPWYPVAKETINNSLVSATPVPFSEEQVKIRFKDFASKRKLLESQYDYAFRVKAKMRRADPEQNENNLFLDLMNFIRKKNQSFVIFEEPSGEPYDLKYLKSKFSDVTLPFEFVFPLYKNSIIHISSKAMEAYIRSIDALFSDVQAHETFRDQMIMLKQTYHSLSQIIPGIVLFKMILQKAKIKALFGGMGTQFMAGLNNGFSVVEVEHGYHVPSLFVQRDFMGISDPLRAFFKAHLKMDQFFVLGLSAKGEMSNAYSLCFEENMFNYGMPETRAYQASSLRINALKEKYSLGNQPVLLFATTDSVDYQALNRLLDVINTRIPGVRILLRPHPSYEEEKVMESDRCTLARGDNLYDLFQISDVVLSVSHSILVEASAFTDRLVAIPGKYSASQIDVAKIAELVPFAKVIRLQETEKYIEQIQALLNSPKKENAVKVQPTIEKELVKLFKKLEIH